MNNIYVYLLSSINPLKYVIYDLHRIFVRFLWNFEKVGTNNTGWLELIFVFLRRKEDWILGNCLICQMFFLLSCGGISGIKCLYELTLYETSTIRR